MITGKWSEPVGPTVVRVFFVSDLVDPIFYVWLDGQRLGSTSEGFLDVPVGIDQVGQVDIFDDAGEVPEAVFPATVTLLWEVGPEVAVSRIEAWDGAAWRVRAQVPATGSGEARWESAPLEDGAAFLFRAVPVDGEARDGQVREFPGVMCRWPDRPSAAMGVSEGEFVIA